jgi:hypothetical protein
MLDRAGSDETTRLLARRLRIAAHRAKAGVGGDYRALGTRADRCNVTGVTTRVRWLAAGGLSLFVLVIIVIAVQKWTWQGQLETPPNVPAQYVNFRCGAPWGSASVEGPPTTSYVLLGTPCGQRHQYQLMPAVDIILGVIGLVVVISWGRVRLHQPTA